MENTNKEVETDNLNEIKIDQEKLNSYIEWIKSQQNIKWAFLAWTITMLLASIIWATITVKTWYQIWYMSLGLGAAIWFSISFFWKGLDQIYGIIWAILALIWVILWNILSFIGFVSIEEWISLFETFKLIDFRYLPEILMDTFVPMDLIFYWLATVVWFQLSFRKITEEELQKHAIVK